MAGEGIGVMDWARLPCETHDVAFIGLASHLPFLLPLLKDTQILLKCYAVLMDCFIDTCIAIGVLSV